MRRCHLTTTPKPGTSSYRLDEKSAAAHPFEQFTRMSKAMFEHHEATKMNRYGEDLPPDPFDKST